MDEEHAQVRVDATIAAIATGHYGVVKSTPHLRRARLTRIYAYAPQSRRADKNEFAPAHARGNVPRMTDPVYALILLGLALALLVATVAPAPEHPTDDEAGVGLALISAGCVAALAMGVLALLALPAASAVLGAIAWLLVMPCVWLARAPQAQEEWADEEEEEEEDDDGGGSPSPYAPPAPPAPDDRLPGVPPSAAPASWTPAPATAAPASWTPAPAPAPVPATAARVQCLLAEQEAQRLLAAREVERILAAAALTPPPPPATPRVVAPPPVPPAHPPTQPRLRPGPRIRDDHPSIVHALAAVAHARTRRRAGDQAERRTTNVS